MTYSTERSTKRARTNMYSSDFELEVWKEGRRRTFSHGFNSPILTSRMIEAGFFNCNKSDRVICLYCNLVCHRWSAELDDPCEVHRLLSPDCPFVKSMSCCHSPQYNQIVRSLPHHCNYVNPQMRLQSFSTWNKLGFPPTEQLVEAGFCYNNQNIVCFYCNGSLQNCKMNYHPLAEHAQQFPFCNYAKQLCGEKLYHQIQLLKHNQENVSNNTSRNKHHSSFENDPDALIRNVDDRLNWPISILLLQSTKFDKSIIRQCWMDRLQLKDNDFVDLVDLHIACEILQRQRTIIGDDETKIRIPIIELNKFYTQRSLSSINRNTDILASFGDIYQAHKDIQKGLFRQFDEERTLRIERERSLVNWPYTNPSRRDMNNAGWIIYDKEKNIAQCPHCHMLYSQWKFGDDPRLIHKYLAPHCPFVLAENPFRSHLIPLETVGNVWTPEVIRNVDTQPYNGIVPTKNHQYSTINDRKNSFDTFPQGLSIDAEKLAQCGLYYDSRQSRVKCFYCTYRMSIHNGYIQSSRLIKQFHLRFPCLYARQWNDHDSIISNEQTTTQVCSWCSIDDKRLVALPCRHLCLCQSCGPTKQICPTCKQPVTTYLNIFPA